MKKLTILLMVLMLLLTGCGGNKKPDDVSEEMYQKAIYVIKVCDLYSDGPATQEETIEKLEAIDSPQIDIATSSLNEVSIRSGIMGLHSDCIKMKFGGFELSNFKEHRDKIADAINYKD